MPSERSRMKKRARPWRGATAANMPFIISRIGRNAPRAAGRSPTRRSAKTPIFSVRYAGEFLGFFHIMDRAGHVELGVGIKPELCGQGHGHALMTLALETIRRTRGRTPVQLSVRTFNTRAVRCYERAGFTITGTRYEDLGTAPGEMYIMQAAV